MLGSRWQGWALAIEMWCEGATAGLPWGCAHIQGPGALWEGMWEPGPGSRGAMPMH